jgi:DNA replication and repair protein RecF
VFGPGPHLIWGANAAGKTSLLEAMVLLAWGRSHRTSADGELVRWGTDLARIEGAVGSDTLEVAIMRAGATGSAGRKRIRVNGLGRRASGLAGLLRIVVFAPEEMLHIAGSPSLRRAVIDQLAASGSPAYGDAMTTYGRNLQQRNGLLRAIREEGASRDELRSWDGAFLDAGAAIVAERRRLLGVLAEPLAAAHAEIAPDEAAEARLTLVYSTNAPPLPGESPRDALARRLVETADKEVWNGSTLIAASRRPRLRALWARPASFALGPATHRHPGPQARRTRYPDGARRATAPAPPGRRVLGARPRTSIPPGPADRRVAAGVHHDDNAR